MSQRDGFATGFFAGAIFGGLVGGILGAVITSRLDAESLAEEGSELSNGAMEPKKNAAKRRMRASESGNMEMETARRSLEDKIAQLNATIDDVRKQLGDVNGNPDQIIGDRSSLND